MRHAAKRDANEPEIINALKAAGCRVQQLNDADAPDLLVSRDGRNWLLEVKLPLGKKGGGSRSALTPGQFAWHQKWLGPVAVVRSPAEALCAVGLSVDSTGPVIRSSRA